LTANNDRLRDRLEQILRALPVSEGRRDSIKAAALFLDSLSRPPLPGEDVNPTITKQAQREALLRLGSPHLRIDHLNETDSRTLGDALILLYSLSASLRGEDNPTTAKQAERELLALRKRLGALRLCVGKLNKTATDAMASAGIGGVDFDRLGPNGGGGTARPGTVARSARKAAQAARRLDHLGHCLSVLGAHRNAPDATHRSRGARPRAVR